MASRYIAFVLRHRAAVLFLCAAITVPAGWACTRGVFASSMLKLFFGESEKYDEHVRLAAKFGDSDLMVIAFDDPALLSPAGAARLRRIVDAVAANEYVERVESLIDADRIRGGEDSLNVEPYGPLLEAAGDDLRALRAEILDQPLLRNLLVSADGTKGAVLVELARGPERPIEQVPGLLEEMLEPFVTDGIERDRIRLAGMVPESAEATAQARFNIRRIFPATILVLVLVVYLLFLQVWPVLITCGVAAISVIWVFAAAILYDPHVNLMMATVPAVIMVVAFSDIIHLYSAYLLELGAGHAKGEAILKSGAEVGTACFYTSVTTFVGFAALIFVPTPLFRQLGMILGLGVGVSLLLAMTVVPVVLSLLPVPRLASERARTRPGRWIDVAVLACMRVATHWPKLTVLAFAAFAAISAYGISQMRIETDLVKRLDENNPVRRAQAYVTEHFVGTNFMDLYLSVEEGDLLDPKRLAALAELQDRLEAMPQIDRTVSLVDLIEVLHTEMSRGTKVSGRLPTSRALISQYLLLFEMSGGEGVGRLADEEYRTLRVTVRLPGTGLVTTKDLGNRAAEIAHELLGPEVEVVPTGLTYLFGDWIEFIVAGQKRGLSLAVLTIAAMMIITMRRVGAGLVSMIPNLLPLAALGGYVGLAWPAVDSDTILVAMIAIGIAVDDTIHFLTRLRIEAARAATIDEALRDAFTFTGRAIVLTTVILCAGFAPFATSDYFTTEILGTLLPLTLAVALVADLMLVPALVKLGILRVTLASALKGE